MTLKNNNNLFDFDEEQRNHCFNSKEIASIDNQSLTTKSKPRNDVVIIGTDEAGRGPGAGGVFASAVYFNSLDEDLINKLSALNDSKKLSKKTRESLYEIILKNTINSTVCIEVEEIEKINILNASLKAMKLAVENVIKEINASNVALNLIQGRRVVRLCDPESSSGRRESLNNILVLVDGNKLIKDLNYSTTQPLNPSTTIHQKCIVKGDSKSASIAAASILAKVSRDRYMEELDKKFPQYNWIKNAGYLTAEHLKAIDKYGITPIHRKTFLRKHFEKNIQQKLELVN